MLLKSQQSIEEVDVSLLTFQISQEAQKEKDGNWPRQTWLMTESYTVLSIGDLPASDSFVKPRETLCSDREDLG